MKKIVFITISALLLVLAAPGCNSYPGTVSKSSTVSTSNYESISLHETPQTYELAGDDPLKMMPAVTLYENGSARLSQPMLSSFKLIGTGYYQASGHELTVTHGEKSATFSISNGGDTLTLKSASLGFTKAGAVYQYRSNKEYLDGYNRIDGGELTLELVRKLAKKGHLLNLADFRQYACVAINPDHKVFDVEGKYTLTVIYGADGDTYCTIERNASGESFPLSLNGSTGLVFEDFLGIENIPEYKTQKWLDFLYADKMPWGEIKELSLPEFPGVTFTWTGEKVTADGKDLIFGMPVWNVFLSDLTNDGKPEICATVSLGSGIIDTRVVVYDYVNAIEYQLADRMTYDYFLSMEDGKLMVTQTDYNDRKPLAITKLQLVNGEIFWSGKHVP